MGQVQERIQCPQCKDSHHDNLAVYKDGHYCHACGWSDKHDGVPYKMVDNQNIQNFVLTGEYSDLTSRAISRDTCSFYHYQVQFPSGSLPALHIANYYEGTQLIAQKIRTPDKKMWTTGDASKMRLYGQQLWNPAKNIFCVVTEGEIDALSIAEVMGTRYPVVSIPKGAGHAKQAIEQSLEWLNGWKHVVLCFDNDEAGKKATEECISLFAPGMVRITALAGYKDANEMLVAGKGSMLKEAIWNARDTRPSSIISVSDVIEDALKKPEYGLSWPFESLTRLTYGIHSNQIYTLGAGSGQGKTEFLKELIYHLVTKHGQKVGAIFLEQKPADTLKRLAGCHINKRIHIPGVNYDELEVRGAMEYFQDKVYLYGGTADEVMDKLRYYVLGLGCKYIVLDHLTALAAGMEDERKQLDSLMKQLATMVQQLNFTIFLISHLAKPSDGGPTYEEGRPVTDGSFRGSQSIMFWSSFTMGLERNKRSGTLTERRTSKIRVLKDRFSGEADGCTVDLEYNPATGRLKESQLDMVELSHPSLVEIQKFGVF